MRTRIGCVVGLAAAGLVLCACSDSDEPGTLPDVTPTGSSAAAEESTPATPSVDPTAHLEAEITRFYEDYVATINESFSSTDALQGRREMFADSCSHCEVGYKLAERAHADGLTFSGGLISVTSIGINTISEDHATFTVVSDSSPGVIANLDGDSIQEIPASAGVRVTYQAQRGPSGWVIVSSQVVQ